MNTCRVILSIGILCLLYVSSSTAQSLSDGVTFRTWDEFKGELSGLGPPAPECPMLNHELARKLQRQRDDNTALTGAEYLALVGDDYPLFGVRGGQEFYVRSAGELMDGGAAYLTLNGFDRRDQSLVSDPEKRVQFMTFMQTYSYDSFSDDTPILCGDGSVENQYRENERRRIAEAAARKAEYERTCEACTLQGGPLLQAIYDGDFQRQDRIARIYVSSIGQVGGPEILAMGVLMNSVAGTGDLTLLEDLIGYYMLSTSRRWDDACYVPGARRVTFTTTYPEQAYETLDGVPLGSDPGFTRVTEYRINPKFDEACDRFCNRNGGVLLTAKMASGFGEELAAVKVFRGMDEFIEKYACNSPQMAQLEDNLLGLWAQERAQPASIRRNSVAQFFR